MCQRPNALKILSTTPALKPSSNASRQEPQKTAGCSPVLSFKANANWREIPRLRLKLGAGRSRGAQRYTRIFSHLFKVGFHTLPRANRIAVLNCFQNSFVMKLSAVGTAGNAKNSQPLLAKQADDGINKR